MTKGDNETLFEAAEDVYNAVKRAYHGVPDQMKPQIYGALLEVVVSYSFAFAVKELMGNRAEGAAVPMDGISEGAYRKLMKEVSEYIETAATRAPGPEGVSDMERVVSLAFALGAKTRTVLDRELADIPDLPEGQETSEPNKF